MTWFSDNYPDSTIDDWPLTTTDTADDYHDLRGNSTWVDGDETLKEQAIQRARDWLRGLSWKDDVFDTELPDRVTSAEIVAAFEEFKSSGVLQPMLDSGNFLEEKSIAGVIKKKFRSNAPPKKEFLEINSLLQPFLLNAGAGVELGRG